MPSNNDLVLICDRQIQSATEFKAHAITLANLQGEIKTAQTTLAGLQAQIAEAKRLAAEIEEINQHVRTKRSELAELQATIAKKHEEHGAIDGDLRALMKRAQKLTEVT